MSTNIPAAPTTPETTSAVSNPTTSPQTNGATTNGSVPLTTNPTQEKTEEQLREEQRAVLDKTEDKILAGIKEALDNPEPKVVFGAAGLLNEMTNPEDSIDLTEKAKNYNNTNLLLVAAHETHDLYYTNLAENSPDPEAIRTQITTLYLALMKKANAAEMPQD